MLGVRGEAGPVPRVAILAVAFAEPGALGGRIADLSWNRARGVARGVNGPDRAGNNRGSTGPVTMRSGPESTRSDRPDGGEAALWLEAVASPVVVAELEEIYGFIRREVEARGPACWASGRCCSFERAGHRLYTTGLEAAYTVTRLEPERRFGQEEINAAITVGGCPFQEKNLCSVHAIRPLGCRVYFCDRSVQDWQRELTERAMGPMRELHDRHGIPYVYAEWRALLGQIVASRGP